MSEGARNYLAALGETPPEVIGRPFIPVPAAPAAQGVKHWNHNGSSLRLEVNKATRRFVFTEPREGLREVGVAAGMVVFEGKRIGKPFEGTAYVFSLNCGAVGYQVKGPIARNERSITLKGYAPYVDSECRTSAGGESVLFFELMEN